ncbi:MAG TPA: alkaline phosphatase family protein [Terriglobia bacterium]|nr:alkaline phosphatase family protein [Terriglobia bacterium]
MKLDRRNFLQGAAVTSGAALLGSAAGLTSQANLHEFQAAPEISLPAPQDSGIEHVVVVMMENRSFDHFLGWLPGADGKQAGLQYLNTAGVSHSTHPLAPDFRGCPHPDPDHSYNGGRTEYNGGTMDGFLRAGSDNVYSIGYYVEEDLPFYSALARNYTAMDRYFCSILAPTFPNRLFLHAANTDRLTNSVDFTSLPTIWDQLAENGVSRKYYFSNVPILALWGLKYLDISAFYEQFLDDAAGGTLPAVSFVDPRFTLLDLDTANDDHTHSNVKRGDSFLAQTFHALANGPDWRSTVLVITFDEWGGFFDHVPPPRAAQPVGDPDSDVVNGQVLLGLRVPAVVASPFSLGNPDQPSVQHTIFDHTSILKLIEWRWGLPPLTARDASTDVGNLAQALDFSNPNPAVPDLPSPPSPSPNPCLEGLLEDLLAETAVSRTPFRALANSPQVEHWPVRRD